MTDQELNQRFAQIADSIEHLAQAQLDTDREINALVSVQRDALQSLQALYDITSTHTAQIARLVDVQAETWRQLQAYLTTIHPRQ